MSKCVKRCEIRNVSVNARDIATLATIFPSLESLAFDHCSLCDSPPHVDGRRILQFLGGLKNFHTLELDSPRKAFATHITTESGSSTLVTLSVLSSLHTLLVPVGLLRRVYTRRQAAHLPYSYGSSQLAAASYSASE